MARQQQGARAEVASEALRQRATPRAGATLGPLDAVVGHSMGGSALAVALTQGLRARRAVLLASPSSVAGVIDRFVDAVGLPPAAARRFAREVERTVGRAPGDFDIARLGRGLAHVPALVVHDPADGEIPFADGRAIATAWPGARLVTVEGVGHRRLLADDDVVEAVTAFVA